MKRSIAIAAVAAVIGYLVRSEICRRAEKRREGDERLGSLLRAELRQHAWLLDETARLTARFRSGEQPQSLTIVTRTRDGHHPQYSVHAPPQYRTDMPSRTEGAR
jgi:hypothetical protein